MNTTTKPGVLQVMDAEIASLPIMAEMMTGHDGDAFDAEEAVRRMTEVRATVERLAEALEQSQAALRTAATFRYTRATWARDIAAPAIAAGDAALAAFRGEQP